MKEKLIQLFNTLNEIEVKGKSALLMADCLRFVDQLAQEAAKEQEETANGK